MLPLGIAAVIPGVQASMPSKAAEQVATLDGLRNAPDAREFISAED